MYDIIIIGSGPAGLTAAIYASRARLRTLVLERDTMGAGQIAVTEQVDNYPGLLHIGGYELGEKFREHAESLGASICENDVERLTKQDGVFQIALADGTTVSAKSVIYAAGTSYRKLDVPGAELPGVSYCATCDGAFYQERQWQSSAAAIRRWEMPCIWHAWQRLSIWYTAGMLSVPMQHCRNR